ncbi:MAG: metallophosphoesterase [Thermotogota bacterium]
MKKRYLFFLIIAGFLIYIFLIEPNFIIIKKEISINTEKIQGEVKFIQISDLHINNYYFFHDLVLKKIERINPDFIVYTGDSLRKNTDQESLNKFFKLLSEFSEVYVIYGNWDFQDLNKVNQAYAYKKIHLIEGKSEMIEVRNNRIMITGLPMFYKLEYYENYEDLYSLFLTHVPDNIQKNNEIIKNSDLTLAGHTHGGQVFIPFITKLLINKIGNYSEFLKGMHDYKNTKVYINRGLGSWFSLRFLTPPEITIFNLKGE